MYWSHLHKLVLTLFLYLLIGCDVDQAMDRLENYAQDRLTTSYENGVTKLFTKRCKGNEHCLSLVVNQISSCSQRLNAQIRELLDRPDMDEELVHFRMHYWLQNCVVSKSGFPLLYELDLAHVWGLGPFFSDSDIEKLGLWHRSLPSDVGGSLFVDEIMGWDWQRVDRRSQVGIPPFSTKLAAIWLVDGQRRGVVAHIKEPGHRLNDMWVVIYARSGSAYDPSTQSALYLMQVGATRPMLTDGRWPQFEGPPVFAGFARVSSRPSMSRAEVDGATTGVDAVDVIPKSY